MAILYDNEGNQINMSEVAANTSDISNLKSRVTTAEGDISALETTTTGLVANKEILGAKNLIPLTLSNLKAKNTGGVWSDNTYTHYNITYTVNTNDNGYVTSITANGTATGSNSQLILSLQNTSEVVGKILNGAGDGTGRDTVFIIGTYLKADNGYAGEMRQYNSTDVVIPEVELAVYFRPAILVMAGTTIDNLTFKPMIRLASDNNPTYEPYAMSNQELTQKVLDLEARVTALE